LTNKPKINGRTLALQDSTSMSIKLRLVKFKQKQISGPQLVSTFAQKFRINLKHKQPFVCLQISFLSQV